MFFLSTDICGRTAVGKSPGDRRAIAETSPEQSPEVAEAVVETSPASRRNVVIKEIQK